MNAESDIEILNELLELEARGFLPRLRESLPFVSWSSAHERRILDRLIDERHQHAGWLVETIHGLGGDPLPVRADIRSTNIHYLDLAHLLPEILKNAKSVLAAYESAASHVSENPATADVITRISQRHRHHLEQLSQLTAKIEPTKT